MNYYDPSIPPVGKSIYCSSIAYSNQDRTATCPIGLKKNVTASQSSDRTQQLRTLAIATTTKAVNPSGRLPIMCAAVNYTKYGKSIQNTRCYS